MPGQILRMYAGSKAKKKIGLPVLRFAIGFTVGEPDQGCTSSSNATANRKACGKFGVRGVPGGDCFLRFSRERLVPVTNGRLCVYHTSWGYLGKYPA